MFGWISEEMAASEGFTNHASYYGVPIYWRDDDSAVWCKHWVFDMLFDVAGFIEGVMRPILYPDQEPCFQFKIGRAINK